MADRIFVVGHAAVTCLGRDMDSTWRGLIEGRSGIRRHRGAGLASHSSRIWAGWWRTSGRARRRKIRRSRSSRRGSSTWRWPRRGRRGPTRVSTGRSRGWTRIASAVVMGSAFGGLDLLEAEQARMLQRRSPAISPYLVPAMIINQAAGQIAQHLGLYGPGAAPANACASGGHAVVLGAMFLRSGEADVALCGAAESAFTPPVVNGFATMKALLGKKPGDRSERRPGAGQPAVQRRSGRFRPGRRGRGPRPGDRVGREPAGTGAPGRARGLVHQFRRAPHGHALPRSDRPLPGDGAGARPA